MKLARAIGLAWVCCTVIGACASGGGALSSPVASASPPVYVVRPHDTLYSIAWRHDLDYRDLARWNGLGSDFKLAIGQVLVLQPNVAAPAVSPPPSPPAASAYSAPQRAAPAPRVDKPVPLGGATAEPATAGPPAGNASGGSAPTAASMPSAAANLDAPSHEPAAAGTVSSVGGQKWVWPTDRLSAPRPVPGGGILLFGQLGQDVRAAGTGRVVYTGNGIRGYGNLIIIKHGDSLLSSYAHNRELLVREGQEVAMGQVIAHMGTGPHQVCALYFEIRVNGKPTDPLRYLAGVH